MILFYKLKVISSNLLQLSMVVTSIVAIVLVGMLAIASPAYAQGAIRKEVMERLFFNQAQRSVLESVRQGVIDRNLAARELEDIETTAIEIPEIIFRTQVRKEKTTGRLIRERSLSYNGIIRMRNGKANIMLDGSLLDDNELKELEDSIGVTFTAEEPNKIVTEDRLFKQRYALKRGDSLLATGSIGRTSSIPGQRFIIVKRDK